MLLLVTLAALALAWWWLRGSPVLAGRLRWLGRTGEWAAGAVALVMLLRGRPEIALLFAGLAGYLAHLRGGLRLPRWAGGGGPPPGAASRQRSALLEVEAAAGGVMDGTVLSGPLRGRRLATLSPAELLALHDLCRRTDPAGLALLEPYLDRRLAGWREHAERHADPRPRAPASMTEDEAYKVLGLAPGADAEAVRESHRRLIKRLHPDGGGSAELAARVNEAKDVLLGRHRR